MTQKMSEPIYDENNVYIIRLDIKTNATLYKYM